jgi:hypothetical protein
MKPDAILDRPECQVILASNDDPGAPMDRAASHFGKYPADKRLIDRSGSEDFARPE